MATVQDKMRWPKPACPSKPKFEQETEKQKCYVKRQQDQFFGMFWVFGNAPLASNEWASFSFSFAACLGWGRCLLLIE